MQSLAYQTAFKFNNFGEAAAMIVLFSALIFGICMAYSAIGSDSEVQE